MDPSVTSKVIQPGRRCQSSKRGEQVVFFCVGLHGNDHMDTWQSACKLARTQTYINKSMPRSSVLARIWTTSIAAMWQVSSVMNTKQTPPGSESLQKCEHHFHLSVSPRGASVKSQPQSRKCALCIARGLLPLTPICFVEKARNMKQSTKCFWILYSDWWLNNVPKSSGHDTQTSNRAQKRLCLKRTRASNQQWPMMNH